MPHSWRKIYTVVTIILLLMVLLLRQFGSPVVGYLMERQVYLYLQEQGYRNEDIADIHIIYDPERRHAYTAEAIFLDHGGYKQYYCYNEDKIVQSFEKIEK